MLKETGFKKLIWWSSTMMVLSSTQLLIPIIRLRLALGGMEGGFAP